jgi:ABC-2 type transport system permease protein
MRNYLAILEKELQSYFFSPVAYVVLALFMIVTGFFFYINIIAFDDYSMRQSMMYAQQYRQVPPPLNVNMMAIRPLFHNIAILGLIILLPALTMRLFAEEKRQGTMELLATSPITNWQITLGKFTSALLFYLTMLLVSGLLIGLLFFFGNPEFWPILSGYLGLLLLGGCLISVGSLCSAFTENQIIALISAFAVNLVLLALGSLSNFTSSTLAQFFSSLSPIEHFDDFTQGIIDTKHVIFYLSFMFGGIFLTYVTVESARWRGMR